MSTAQDNALVLRTLKKAKKEITAGLVLHSDQGSPTHPVICSKPKSMALRLLSKPGSRWTMPVRKIFLAF